MRDAPNSDTSRPKNVSGVACPFIAPTKFRSVTLR